MFKPTIELGRILGIRIRLNWSVLVIFGLIVVSLAVGLFARWHPEWPWLTRWSVAIAAALVFFGSLLAHELAHSFAARAWGLPVRSITLFLFGGVSDIQRQPDTPGREWVIAAVGPLTSLVLGIGFLWLLDALSHLGAATTGRSIQLVSRLDPLASILAWVGPVNVLLAVFNMIPALPLDGGRVLRAGLWKACGDLKRATRWASRVARAIAWAVIAVGVAMIFGLRAPLVGSGLVGGMWLVIIGWFLAKSAVASYRQILVDEALAGVQVSRFVESSAAAVGVDASIDELVERYFVGHDRDRIAVVDGHGFVGMVGFDDIHPIDQRDWPTTSVDTVMRPAADVITAAPDTPAAAVFKQMQRHTLAQVPVVADGQLIGTLVRRHIWRWIRMHSDVDDSGRQMPDETPPSPRRDDADGRRVENNRRSF